MSKTKTKPPLKSFHFDLGDSTDGPIGLCASIVAADKQAALQRLRDLLPLEVDVSISDSFQSARKGEYVCVYINPDMITVEDIDDEDVAEAESA
jgi:hypothetical protein